VRILKESCLYKEIEAVNIKEIRQAGIYSAMPQQY
jgi:hypothetical protein